MAVVPPAAMGTLVRRDLTTAVRRHRPLGSLLGCLGVEVGPLALALVLNGSDERSAHSSEQRLTYAFSMMRSTSSNVVSG